MIDNQFGLIQFPTKTGETEKALFCAKALFVNGWNHDGDLLKLPPIKFDGYKVPGNPRAEGKDYTWYAVLAWVGRKPSPRFCSSREDLLASHYFQSTQPAPISYEDLAKAAMPPPQSAPVTPAVNNNQIKGNKPEDDCMRVGVVR